MLADAGYTHAVVAGYTCMLHTRGLDTRCCGMEARRKVRRKVRRTQGWRDAWECRLDTRKLEVDVILFDSDSARPDSRLASPGMLSFLSPRLTPRLL